MRKTVKIKAHFIFLAWFVIFTHNIIPHNHLPENNTGCHDLIHNSNPDEYNCDGSLKLKNQPEDVSVCHISGFLYHQFNQENLIINLNRDINVNLFGLAERNLIFSNHSCFTDHPVGAASLKAPPVA